LTRSPEIKHKETASLRSDWNRLDSSDGVVAFRRNGWSLSLDYAGIERLLEAKFDEWNFYQGVVDFNSDSESRVVQIRPTVKTMVAWTSIKDECVRTRVWSALRSQQSELRKIPVANETVEIPGILPPGVEGSDEKTPAEAILTKNCETTASKAVIPIFSVYNQMHSELERISKSATKNLQDVELAFVPLDDDAIMKLMTSGADFVGVLSTSSLRYRLSDLLQFLVSVSPGKKLQGLPELLLAIDTETDSKKRAELARKAHWLVLDSGFVLPIGQFNSKLSFPKFVSQVAFRDQFQTSPDYANYRVNQFTYWWDRNLGRRLD
jgi:hypothetical protein